MLFEYMDLIVDSFEENEQEKILTVHCRYMGKERNDINLYGYSGTNTAEYDILKGMTIFALEEGTESGNHVYYFVMKNHDIRVPIPATHAEKKVETE